MKYLIPLLLLAATPLALANNNSQPVTSVTIRSEAEDLAAGFAAAFSELRGSPRYLVMEREGRSIVLVSVQSLEARRGALVVVLDSGVVHIVNPRDVVAISDAQLPKP